jgi:transcription elongation factor GreA
VEMLRAFLSFAKKEGFTGASLASHLRLRKGPPSAKGGRARAPAASRLTPEGHAALLAEMEALKEQRPRIAEDLRRAMMDKDFRENAPLEATRERQAHVESRIRELETLLKHAEVLQEGASPRARAHLGSTLVLRNLTSGAEARYTLVSPSEVKPAEGKISIASPVGKALLERAPGDEVEVSAPAGVLRFRVEKIQG